MESAEVCNINRTVCQGALGEGGDLNRGFRKVSEPVLRREGITGRRKRKSKDPKMGVCWGYSKNSYILHLKSISSHAAQLYQSPATKIEDFAAGKNLPLLQFSFRPHWIYKRQKIYRKSKSELRTHPWVIPIVKVRENGREVRKNRIVSVLKSCIKRHCQEKEALRCQMQQKD